MVSNKQKQFVQDTYVIVRPLPEILSTLDEGGTLDGMPFMPEMVNYSGKRFKISRRIERTCEEVEGSMRYIEDVVFLEDLRCDGSAHGDCQKACMLFWKDAWLEPVDQDSNSGNIQAPEDDIVAQLPTRTPDGNYVCQSTELVKATSPVSFKYFLTYINDIQSKNSTIYGVIRNLLFSFYVRVRYHLSGKEYRYLVGEQVETPRESLDLQPGEWVQVKTEAEIQETLDTKGRNRGLQFNQDMIEFCGRTFRVLTRLENMIDEPSQELIHLEDTVVLENSICEGCRRGGCPRASYFFWREIWLNRVEPS